MAKDDKKVTSHSVTAKTKLTPQGTVINLDKKKTEPDIVQEIEDGTEALLVTYDKDTAQIDVYHNGLYINSVKCDSHINGLVSFYEIVKDVLDKCRKLRLN